MRKISDIIGIPVFSSADGMRLGTVCDVLYSSRTAELFGYYVSVGGAMRYIKFISAENIDNFSESCFWVKNKDVLTNRKRLPSNGELKLYKKDTSGISCSVNGSRAGRVSDMLAESRKIAQLELSNGFAEDILNGRKNISVNNGFNFGNNNIEIND